MPRKARRDAPGALHRVMGSGIARREIFTSATDRDWFVARLCKVLTAKKHPVLE